MNWKIFALFLAALSAALPAFAQHSASEPVLDVSAMDRTVDPCVDFYTYACGGWIKKNPIPPDQSNWGTYGKLEDENRAQLRAILEEAANANRTRDAVAQKIGDYYASCVDEAAIEKLGAKPLLPGTRPHRRSQIEAGPRRICRDHRVSAFALRRRNALHLPLQSGL
jgi:putative endopeptidase